MIQVKGVDSFTDGLVFEYTADVDGDPVMTTTTMFVPRENPVLRPLIDKVDDCLESVLEDILVVVQTIKSKGAK